MKINITIDSECLGSVQSSIEHFAEILKHPSPLGGDYQVKLDTDFDIDMICHKLTGLVKLREQALRTKKEIK